MDSEKQVVFPQNNPKRHIYLIDEFDLIFFFFNLFADPVVTEEFIGDLEKGKAGDLCGLKENDIILSVNGVCINEKSHDAVVGMIKANPYHSVFIVIPTENKK